MAAANRKLGDYQAALKHYGMALDRNQHNRGALEYMGETYLELGQLEKTKDVLARLEGECKRIAVGFLNDGWRTGCEEYNELRKAYDEYRRTR